MRRPSPRLGITLLFACAAIACSSSDKAAPRTAIVVEVRSDLDVPDEIDEVRVEVSAISADAGVNDASVSDAGVQSASGSLDDAGIDFPVSVVLEPAPGVTAVRVVAKGLLDGVVVSELAERAEFVPDEIIFLRLKLTRDGGGDGDGDGDGDGGSDAAVDAGNDAGDSGACPAETCNGEDDDCDDRVDEGAEICPQDLPFAVTACMPDTDAGASCQFVRCEEEHLRCDGDEGCETAISKTDCGECSRACGTGQRCSKLPGDSEFSCKDGACPEDQLDVCESMCTSFQTSPQHCGGCHVPPDEIHECGPAPAHAAPSCEAGECALNCVGSFRSCDEQKPAPGTPEYTNGCETDTNSSAVHCGRCDNECPAAGPNTEAYCEEGMCKTRCTGDFLECDDAIDGCETDGTTTSDCFECDVACTGLTGQCCANTRTCRTTCIL